MARARLVGSPRSRIVFNQLPAARAALASALGRAVVAGALPVTNRAVELAAWKTGTLRRSIHTEIVESTAERARATVGTDLPYARRIEYGFSGADRLGRVYHQAPRPYLRPALAERRDEAVREMRAVFRLALERTVR